MTHRSCFLDWLPWHRHHRHHHVGLRIGDVLVILKPWETIRMETSLTVGQTLPMTIQYLDQNGQPMATTPTPDAPPVWSNSNPAAGTLSASADGLDAHEQAIAAGADTVEVSLSVGGVPFSASLAVAIADVVPPAQVLTSIAIVPGTPS